MQATENPAKKGVTTVNPSTKRLLSVVEPEQAVRACYLLSVCMVTVIFKSALFVTRFREFVEMLTFIMLSLKQMRSEWQC